MYFNNRLEAFIVPRVLWSWCSSFIGFVGNYLYDVLGPSHIVLECNAKVPMLLDLLQQSLLERDVDDMVWLKGKDDDFRDVDEEMPIPSRLPEIKCGKDGSDLLQDGDDFIQFASHDARHAYLWYGFSFVGPVTHFWLSEMKKRLLNASAFSPSDLATVSFAKIHVLCTADPMRPRTSAL